VKDASNWETVDRRCSKQQNILQTYGDLRCFQREQEELRKIEDWTAAEEKRRAQLEMKNMLDQTLKTKRVIQARQAQEELAFDLKMLEELLKQAQIEESEQELRKVRLVEK
jgi:hypothetical protein